MKNWATIPDQSIIDTTMAALEKNGMHAILVETAQAAKAKALELIPQGAEVMTMTSETLDAIGLSSEINESGHFDAVKPKLYALDPKTQKREQKRLGTVPEYVIGSVHAVTQDGKVLVATNSGSQLPAYIYGADHVLWIVGAQKITSTLEEGMQRVEEYVLPLESERAKKAYGAPGSQISRMLITNKEPVADRTTIIFVKEILGY